MRTFEEAYRELTGREAQTTLWSDFAIADRFGQAAVRDTYRRAKEFCSTDPLLWGEMTIVLNWRSWNHHDAGRNELAFLYCELCEKATDDFYSLNTNKEDQRIYFELTD